MAIDPTLIPLLSRIADALERMAPTPIPPIDFQAASAFVWSAGDGQLKPVDKINRIPLSLLRGIDRQSQQILENTERFARGLPANNALLWGARGMGKSSIVKAVHAEVAMNNPDAALKLIELHREDISSLPDLLNMLRASSVRAILFCDDLSFDRGETSYKSLKAVLDGGVEGRPDNVIFYATSNRRHLMPRDMIENEQSTAINPGEAVEESVSLSDRFGLWLGFHPCSQDVFFDMVKSYAAAYGLVVSDEEIEAKAREWQVTRGSRSGRVAWQFIQDLAGELGQKID